MKNTQYLTFYIGNEVFALEVLSVSEIIPYGEITYIPKMQPFVMGVMNIRGNIVPIVSLNKRLDLNLDMDLKKQSIIILSLTYDNEVSNIGVIVSKVDQVFTLEDNHIESSPAFGSKVKKEFIKNIVKFNDTFISILEIKEILNLEHLSLTMQTND